MIHYDLIGSHPEVQPLAASLPALIENWQRQPEPLAYDGSAPSLTALIERVNSAEQFFDEMLLIIKAAEHFYGLTFEDFGSMPDLISAIESSDQDLMVH